MHKRIGKFALYRELVDRDEELARAIMGRCVILRCEMMYADDTLEYVALSPDFDSVSEGELPPSYDVIISDRGKRIEFIRTKA